MTSALTYHPTGATLQDFAYDYDLAGNILKIRDRTPDCGILNSLQGTNALDRDFTYDPLYRLLTGTGRECAIPPPCPPWDDSPRCHDVTLTRPYQELYTYDPTGSMTQLRHTAGNGSFTRDFILVLNSNRLQTMVVGRTTCEYTSDANGSMIGEGTSRHFEWDHSDQMRVFRNQVDGSQPTVYANYLYDSDGRRVKTLVRKQNGNSTETTVYIGAFFEHRTRVQGAVISQNNDLNIVHDRTRFATRRVGSLLDANSNSPENQYHLDDHLGSCHLVIDANAVWINREEFTPYGETSYGGYSNKRYRFIGKERQEESGLSYFGARYYAAWLARWSSADPAGLVDGMNLYIYAKCCPAVLVDTSGLQSGTTDPSRVHLLPGKQAQYSGLQPTLGSQRVHLHVMEENRRQGRLQDGTDPVGKYYGLHYYRDRNLQAPEGTVETSCQQPPLQAVLSAAGGPTQRQIIRSLFDRYKGIAPTLFHIMKTPGLLRTLFPGYIVAPPVYVPKPGTPNPDRFLKQIRETYQDRQGFFVGVADEKPEKKFYGRHAFVGSWAYQIEGSARPGTIGEVHWKKPATDKGIHEFRTFEDFARQWHISMIVWVFVKRGAS